MGWPSKLTDRELKRDSLLISCTSPPNYNMVICILCIVCILINMSFCSLLVKFDKFVFTIRLCHCFPEKATIKYNVLVFF